MTQLLIEKTAPTAEKTSVHKKRARTPAPQSEDKPVIIPLIIPIPNLLEVRLSVGFQIIRNNFKKYNTKAKYHLNSRFIQPQAESNIINERFDKDEELQRLMQYLNLSLNDFAGNLKRFLRGVKNSDYKLVISPRNLNSPNISISVQNAKGKTVGPFLSTSVRQDNIDGYDRFDVSIGYTTKNQQRVITHFFSYNSEKKADELVEQRGTKEYLKTENQILHDHFNEFNLKQLRQSLKNKHR